jgi:hypothetical protein
MSSFVHKPYISKQTQERISQSKCLNVLTPFKAQEVVYEILENHLITNDPAALGFGFHERYDTVQERSQIFLGISNDFKAKTTNKRPAVYVIRGDASIQSSQTIGQTVGSNVADSLDFQNNKIVMPISVVCIATNVGFTESFADYIRYPFMYFSMQIEKEYCFHKFRLVNISSPKAFTVDAQASFSIELRIDTEFNDTWTIRKDDLKLRSVVTTVFTDDSGSPLENQ